MANRYWTGAVNGGTGTWDTTDTTNWSTTSGGAGGASVPTTADFAIFDANSGSGVCTLGSDVVFSISSFSGYLGTIDFDTFKMQADGSGTTTINLGTTATLLGSKRIELTSTTSSGTRSLVGNLGEVGAPDIYVLGGSDTIAGGIRCRDLNFTGFSGVMSSAYQYIYGDLTMSPTMTTSGTVPIHFASTSATPRAITSNGVQFNFELRFAGVGGSWELQDDLLITSTAKIEFINGTLDANDFNVTCGGFRTNTGTKTLVMGSGTWELTGTDATFNKVWRADWDGNNFTVVPEAATITMTAAGAKTFAGAGKTYPTLNQGGAGALTIQQSNSFANITNSVQPSTITLTSGTTQTVGAFSVSGTAGNLVTLNTSTPGSQATLSDSAGTNSVSFVSLQDINATGGATWDAFLKNGNVDAGNNVGWDFRAMMRKVFRAAFTAVFRPVFSRRKAA